jgi:hypothetical protein
MSIRLPIYVENQPQKRFAEGMLRPYPVEVVAACSASGAISMAESSLLNHPEKPLAVLIETRTEKPREVEEIRGAGLRLLASCAWEGWFLALGVPRLEAWAVTDPRIKQDFESRFGPRTLTAEKAARFEELTGTIPFDPSELLRTCPDFQGLVAFIQRITSPIPGKDLASAG